MYLHMCQKKNFHSRTKFLQKASNLWILYLDFKNFSQLYDMIDDLVDSLGDDGVVGDVSVDVFKVRSNTSFESQLLIVVWLNSNP